MGLNPLDLVNPVGAVIDYFQGKSNAKAARDAFRSRYQDTVADMKKAGLNPALAYGQGGGNPQTHDQPMVGEELVKGMGTSAVATQARATAENTRAQTDLLKAQTKDLIDQTKLRNAEILTHTALMGAQSGVALRQQDQINATIEGLSLDNDFRRQTLTDRVATVKKELDAKGVAVDTARVQQTLLELQKAEAQAYSDYYKTRWGKREPYMNSAGAVARNIAQLIPGMKINFGPQPVNTFNYGGRR